jgi:hypothetical protein
MHDPCDCAKITAREYVLKPPADYKFELFTVALVGALIGVVPLLIVLAVTHNFLWALGTWAVVPAIFAAYSAVNMLRYARSTPGDHRYRFRAFYDSSAQVDIVEDEALKVALKVFELNQQAQSAAEDDHDHSQCSGDHHNHPLEGRRSYPCSMAVPKEVWEKNAAASAEKAAWLAARAKEESPESAVRLLTRAASIYSNIAMGLRFDGDALKYRLHALPLLQLILQKVDAVGLTEAERIDCLEHVASIAQMLGADSVACEAFEKLLPVIREERNGRLAAAASLSNYGYSAKRAGNGGLAAALKAEANALWKGVPQEQIEAEMLR